MAKRVELNEEERERTDALNDEVLKNDPRPASAALAGPLKNPGFEAVPWVARNEMNRNLGKYCPVHLQSFTEEELKPAHYRLCAKDDDGNPCKWCWACGRPLKWNGLSGKSHVGTGKPCPSCGFRRKRVMTPKQAAALEKNKGVSREKRQELARLGFNSPQALAKRRGTPKVTELLQERAEKMADEILRPYFEGLKVKPKGEWSPSTKLEFYLNQTQIAEKLMNRVEGMPVARTRHVTKEDDDVLRDDELSPEVLVQMVAAIATGADIGALLGEVTDAEVVDEEDVDEA